MPQVFPDATTALVYLKVDRSTAEGWWCAGDRSRLINCDR
jgi:hypothetical protein